MNNYDMEANSRPDLLTSFKVAYGESIRSITAMANLPKIVLGAWAWGNDGTFGRL